MPGFDGTGPMGLGPLTGRGMGYCAVQLPPSSTKAGPNVEARLGQSIPRSFHPYQSKAFAGFFPGPMAPRPPRPSIHVGRGFRHGIAHRRRSSPLGW